MNTRPSTIQKRDRVRSKLESLSAFLDIVARVDSFVDKSSPSIVNDGAMGIFHGAKQSGGRQGEEGVQLQYSKDVLYTSTYKEQRITFTLLTYTVRLHDEAKLGVQVQVHIGFVTIKNERKFKCAPCVM